MTPAAVKRRYSETVLRIIHILFDMNIIVNILKTKLNGLYFKNVRKRVIDNFLCLPVFALDIPAFDGIMSSYQRKKGR